MRRLRLLLLLALTPIVALAGASWSAASAVTTATYTIFGSATPAVVDAGDSNAVELGVKFTAAANGSITGVRFYKAPANTGTHVGALWTARGTLLARAKFTGETASGWQTVNFTNPISITAGTTYVAGYYAPHGHYADSIGGLSSATTNGPLTAVGNGSSPDGVYTYAANSSFPAGAWKASNYYVDVNFVPASPSVPTPVNITTSPTTTSPTTSAPVNTPGPPGSPVNTSPPVIHGYATPNSELMANDGGTWTGSPTTYSYHWQDCNSSGTDCSNATNTTGLTGDPCSPTAFCYVPGNGDLNSTIRVVVTAQNSNGASSTSSSPTSVVSSSEPVNCALTHAAGFDATIAQSADNNNNSCWGQATGISGATGCTEAQIVAKSPAQCGPPYITQLSGDQSYSTSNTVVANAYITGCVALQPGATHFHMRDVLIYTTNVDCQNTSGDSNPGAWNDGNDTNVPAGVLVEDTEVDGRSTNLEANPTNNNFGLVMGVGGTCLRCNIFGFAKGASVNGAAGAVTTLQDSFIHDPPRPASNSYDCGGAGDAQYDPHEDLIWGDSASYVTVEHDYVSAVPGGDCVTAAITFLSDWGAPTHDTVDDSYAEGGILPGNGRPDAYFGKSGVCATYTSVTNNAFSNDQNYGIQEWNPGNTGDTWSGNYVAESSQAMSAPNDC